MSKTKSQNVSNGALDRRTLLKASVLGAAAAGVVVPASAQAPDADESQPGTVYWSEYLTKDLARMSFFYSSVVGWKMKLVSLDDPSRLAQAGENGYMVMMSGTDEAAGVMRIADAEFTNARSGWFTYLQVENVDEAVSRAVRLGGKVVQKPFDENENTRIAVIEDLEGCMAGLVSHRKA
jgi:hypothetical protein